MILISIVALLQGDAYRIEPKLEAQGGSLVVSGTTTLPDEAVVRIDVFRAQTIEGEQLVSKAVKIVKGKFQLETPLFEGRVPPGQFVARVRYHVSFQVSFDVIKAAEGKPQEVSKEAVLEVGTKQEFLQARAEHGRRLGKDLDEILAALDRSIGGERTDSVKQVRDLLERRRREHALDFHFGLAGLAGTVERASAAMIEANQTMMEMAERGEDPAPEGKKCRDSVDRWVRDAHRTLREITGRAEPLKDRVDAVRRSLTQAMEFWENVPPDMPREEVRKRLEGAREQTLIGIEKIAEIAGDMGYGQVESVAQAFHPLFDALELEPRNPQAVIAARDRVLSGLDALDK